MTLLHASSIVNNQESRAYLRIIRLTLWLQTFGVTAMQPLHCVSREAFVLVGSLKHFTFSFADRETTGCGAASL